jgi:hypothetical protein
MGVFCQETQEHSEVLHDLVCVRGTLPLMTICEGLESLGSKMGYFLFLVAGLSLRKT